MEGWLQPCEVLSVWWDFHFFVFCFFFVFVLFWRFDPFFFFSPKQRGGDTIQYTSSHLPSSLIHHTHHTSYTMSLPDFSQASNLSKLDDFLADKSYVDG